MHKDYSALFAKHILLILLLCVIYATMGVHGVNFLSCSMHSAGGHPPSALNACMQYRIRYNFGDFTLTNGSNHYRYHYTIYISLYQH